MLGEEKGVSCDSCAIDRRHTSVSETVKDLGVLVYNELIFQHLISLSESVKKSKRIAGMISLSIQIMVPLFKTLAHVSID